MKRLLATVITLAVITATLSVRGINTAAVRSVSNGHLLVSLGDTIIDYKNKQIYGLTTGMTSLAGRVKVSSGYELLCENIIGSGTCANVTLNGTVVESYKILIFGDLNSDGNIDSTDAGKVEDFENYIITWDPITEDVYLKSADVNGDGNIDSLDAGIIVDSENYLLNIDQKTRIAEKDPVIGVRFKYVVDETIDYLKPCERMGDAASMTQPDFDNIYPYNEIVRCNIKLLPNGQNIITYENEDGFTLDGSNGSVFVEIPKHYIKRLISDGYEYRYISKQPDDGYIVDPAFVENGRELDAIYVSAYEACVKDGELNSMTDVYPSVNYTRTQFRAFAQANGTGYGILDMRTLNMLQNLFIVEYASLNAQTAVGGGWGKIYQPTTSKFRAVVNENDANRIIIGDWTPDYSNILFVGLAIQCVKYLQPNTVLMTDHTITSIEINTPQTGQTTINFDGVPVDITTDFVLGGAAQKCGRADSLQTATGKTSNNGTDLDAVYRNAVRYRYMENLWGNTWSWIDGINLDNGRVYYAENMSDYISGKITHPYKPVSEILELQTSNGSVGGDLEINYLKNLTFDSTNPALALPKNYMNQGVTSVPASQTYPRLGSNTLRSDHFGDYYYLSNTSTCYAQGGGFDHYWRCGLFTLRGWWNDNTTWYLIGSRLIYKPL